MTDDVDRPGAGERNLAVWAYLVVVVAYLVVIQVLGIVLTSGIDVKFASPTTVDELWRSLTVPIGLSLLLVIAVVTALRWWRPVLVEDLPVQRWLVLVPVIMIVAILLATNYAGLADRGLSFTLLLLLSMMFVGFGEELMFRGLAVTTFRRNGFSEAKVALWSTVIFGLAHASNLISTGPKAFVQVLVAALSGYFFYLIRRRSGGILLPAVIHGLWDFSLLSASVVPDKGYPGPVINVLAIVVLGILVLVRRHRIEPASAG